MNTASEISKPRARLARIPLDDRVGPAAERRRDRRQWYRLFAPPDVRHRRREARRWLLELAVRTTNPRVCERRPGQRLFETCAERRAVGDASYEKLRMEDPELLCAVERVRFEDAARDMGITLEERKTRWHRRSERVSRVRAEMQRAGLI
jgi:hypothetical protein